MIYALNCGFGIESPLDKSAYAGQIECAISLLFVVCCLIDWVSEWMSEWVSDWLIDWLIDFN